MFSFYHASINTLFVVSLFYFILIFLYFKYYNKVNYYEGY